MTPLVTVVSASKQISLTISSAMGIDGPRLGQFMGVRAEHVRNIGGVTYSTIIYGAYNAMGLIGSEYNGIAVLNHTTKSVVMDGVARADSGWFGANKQQIAEFERLLNVEDTDFLTFCATNYPEYFRGR